MDKISALFTHHLLIAAAVFTLVLCILVFLLQVILSSVSPRAFSNGYQVMVTKADDQMINPIQSEENDNLETTSTTNLEGVVEVGMQAIVRGTEGRGLRMRHNPGSASEVNYLAQEEERVEIIGGPILEDGYIWWQLRSLDDPSKVGWSVQDYLEIDEQ